MDFYKPTMGCQVDGLSVGAAIGGGVFAVVDGYAGVVLSAIGLIGLAVRVWQTQLLIRRKKLKETIASLEKKTANLSRKILDKERRIAELEDALREIAKGQ